MAEYVSNEELQKEEESGGISLSAIWTIIVLNWQWILLFAICVTRDRYILQR